MEVIIKDSKIKGKGVFAARNLKKGETVIAWHPPAIVSKEDIASLSEDKQNHTTYAGSGKYYVMGSPERFVNHSCEPNTYVKEKKDVALKDIKEGEEITTDYSLNGIEDWEMECKCGSRNCRKIVYGDFRRLDDKTKKRVKPCLEEWFKKELNIK